MQQQSTATSWIFLPKRFVLYDLAYAARLAVSTDRSVVLLVEGVQFVNDLCID
jgi:hypothetical protein